MHKGYIKLLCQASGAKHQRAALGKGKQNNGALLKDIWNNSVKKKKVN